MKKLYRSRDDNFLGGVFGGLGESYNIDPNVLRLIYIFACCVTYMLPLILTYIAAWILIPVGEPKQVVVPRKFYRSYKNRKIAGIFGAIADKLDIDANILRIIFVILAIFPPIGFIPLTIAYLIIWAFLPLEQPQRETYENKANGFAS